jgi:hypothetical protein
MATLSVRRLVIDNLVSAHRGRVANTAGDSVLAEFGSVLDAVSCAVEIQKAMIQANEAEPDLLSMRLRIGINLGDVMVKDGDLFGDGVNVAARIEGLVKGGEICLSRASAITCVIAAAWSSRIWGSSWSRTSPIRSGPFVFVSARTPPPRRLRSPGMSTSHWKYLRLRQRSPNCPPTMRSRRAGTLGQRQGQQSWRTRILPGGVSRGYLCPARPHPAQCSGAVASRSCPADTRGSGRGGARSRVLEFRQGQQSTRGASGLPRATSEWPFRRNRPGGSFLARFYLRLAWAARQQADSSPSLPVCPDLHLCDLSFWNL